MLTGLAGAAAASTPKQSGQRLLPKSKATDLIAPSLANLPNALNADYWLNKINVQEQLGRYQVGAALGCLSSIYSIVSHYFATQQTIASALMVIAASELCYFSERLGSCCRLLWTCLSLLSNGMSGLLLLYQGAWWLLERLPPFDLTLRVSQQMQLNNLCSMSCIQHAMQGIQ